MKAIRIHQFGDPDVLRLEDVPDPTPGDGEVLVRLHAVGVNPVDGYIRSGAHTVKPQLPYTPGVDGAGTVLRVGAGVTHVQPGTRVYLAARPGSVNGTYAEQIASTSSLVHALPDHVSFSQGAAIGVAYATAWRAIVEKAQVQPTETVLVHGASGGVGTAAIQILRAFGATVIGTAGSDEGRALVLAQGAQHAVDHRSADYRDEVRALTGGKGPDVILEMLANVNLNHDLGLIAQRGRIVIIGSRGNLEVTPRLAMNKEAVVMGLMLWTATETETRRLHAGVGAGLANGTLTPVVGEEIPLAEAARAQRRVLEPGAHGKIVLVP